MQVYFAPFAVLLAAASAPAEPVWEEDPYEKAAAVNEGDLRFLAQPPDKPAHHHVNRLTIAEDSLDHGWVALDQCHYDIDPVPRAEIVFTAGRIRNLAIVSHHGIGRAAVTGDSVEIEDIGPGAELCIRAETLGIERHGDTFVLRSGPFMRRFLDGYYPMHVTLDVSFPERLVLVDRHPTRRHRR